MTSLVRVLALASLVVMVSACSEFYTMAPRSLIKTTGNLSMVSSAVVVGTDKSLSDHFVSYRTGKDCSTVRVEQGRSFCREDEPNPMPTMYCYPTLGDVMCYEQPDSTRQSGDALGNLKPELQSVQPEDQSKTQPQG